MIFDEELIFKLKKPAYFDPITYPNGLYSWEVPAGIRFIRIDCAGAQGMSVTGSSAGAAPGGLGGRVQCIMAVTPRSTLTIFVGDQPTVSNKAICNSSMVIGPDNRLCIAGGGGSAACSFSYQPRSFVGGPGGGLTAGIGGNIAGTANNNITIGIGGLPGTQTTGGTGAYFSMYLKSLRAGAGTGWILSDPYAANGGTPNVGNVNGGGYGGCGYFGGGGAVMGEYWAGSTANGSSCAGGGGGSSYTDPIYCSEVTHTQGYTAGHGYVIISMV